MHLRNSFNIQTYTHLKCSIEVAIHKTHLMITPLISTIKCKFQVGRVAQAKILMCKMDLIFNSLEILEKIALKRVKSLSKRNGCLLSLIRGHKNIQSIFLVKEKVLL